MVTDSGLKICFWNGLHRWWPVLVSGFLLVRGLDDREEEESKKHGQKKNSNCHFGLICVVSYFAVVPLVCGYKTLYAKRHSGSKHFFHFFYKKLTINNL
ncbi:MAG: hypothetical protein IPN76_06200 [Saprospiraceae bacterium]|nr:hypothetical protein [Saprospiraceae bacterium]